MNALASTYVHTLEGRLRIKLAGIKSPAIKAREVEGHLQQFSGVEYVSANPATGNVLILYNPRVIEPREIFSFLMELGYLSQLMGGSRITDSPPAVERTATTVAVTITEVALSLLVVALI
jgi:Heavy metal associated domain 2